MKTTFLGQGFEPISTNAVGHHLIAYLNSLDFHSFTTITYFIEKGVVFDEKTYLYLKNVKLAA